MNNDESLKFIGEDLPRGEPYEGKDYPGTNLRTLLQGLSYQFARSHNNIEILNKNFSILESDELIERHEEKVGIPDSCFKTNVSLDQRRKQVYIKWTLMQKAITIADYVEIAECLGYDVIINSGFALSGMPMYMPYYFYGGIENSSFILDVEVTNKPGPEHTFPIPFPITLTSDEDILKCLFEDIAPAEWVIKFRFTGP